MVLKDPGGTGVGMAWDGACPWLQIYTADKQPPLPNRLGLAVEPMTCPPDAFNSGQDLVRLEPGARHRSWPGASSPHEGPAAVRRRLAPNVR